MAKAYLTEQQRLDDEFRRVVRVGMAEQNLKQYQLAEKMQLKATTLQSKLQRPDTFKRNELRLLRKVLKIAPETMAQII